ncbi:hypothetical protein [Caldicellulosiruptor sp. F32]|uniref:hypothetical protein n=1 Tax=Caldicellulosiruptor sp. F32 TaxID=1214564 RepID=UPI0003AA9DE6|nr:hypothetical protein [Caldicellulosiruptor sp. F32]
MEIDLFKETLKDPTIYNPKEEKAYLIVYVDYIDHILNAFLFLVSHKYSEKEISKLIEEKINLCVSDNIKKLSRKIYIAEKTPEEIIKSINVPLHIVRIK